MTTRIQRKRCKGWRKPPGAIYIGRGTKYGNPFHWKDSSKEEAQDLFKQALPGVIASGIVNLEPLRGKVIMCYCSESDPCHGDVIIEYLNNNP
jgi:hypothetical protein